MPSRIIKTETNYLSTRNNFNINGGNLSKYKDGDFFKDQQLESNQSDFKMILFPNLPCGFKIEENLIELSKKPYEVVGL